MDERVAALHADISASESIDTLSARQQLLDLFNVVNAEQDRVTLLVMLQAVIGLAIRKQESEGVDSQPLRNALLADKRLFVLTEAMGPNERVDPSEQLRILEREIAAGRMQKDDFYDLAVSGAQVFGSSVDRRTSSGWFQRIFG